MDAWSDVEGAIQAAIKQRNARLEQLVAASSMLILPGALAGLAYFISSCQRRRRFT